MTDSSLISSQYEPFLVCMLNNPAIVTVPFTNAYSDSTFRGQSNSIEIAFTHKIQDKFLAILSKHISMFTSYEIHTIVLGFFKVSRYFSRGNNSALFFLFLFYFSGGINSEGYEFAPSGANSFFSELIFCGRDLLPREVNRNSHKKLS